MILVYTHLVTPRLRYTFGTIFNQFLGVEVIFTQHVEEFIAHDGPKLSYTKNPLGSELFFKSHSLLFEKGIVDQEINVTSLDGKKIFFQQSEPSSLAFDIFAASFYMLSRYEEYLPHFKDRFQRYSAKESLAYRHGFLKWPIIEYWVLDLVNVIKRKFPHFKILEREFTFVNTIDVDNAFSYLEKGFVRSLGASARSLLNFDLEDFTKRFRVLLGKEYDPYDTFQYMLDLQSKYQFKSIYFFLLADYGHNDKNIKHTSRKFRSLIKFLSDYVRVGIHPSWSSNTSPRLLKKEILRLEDIVKRDIIRSRQHFLKLDLPSTYRTLIDHGIQEDYTMGYASEVGFRAGTSLPFYFYDLDREQKTSLLVHPFTIMDGTLNEYMDLTVDDAQYLLKELIDRLRDVNGCFISLWHNETLSDNRHWKGWKDVYEYMLKEACK